MTVEVAPQPRAEGVIADGRHELLDDGGALLVGDGVEVADRLLRVLHDRRHRVRGDQLVLAMGRRSHVTIEDLPGIPEAGGRGQAAIGQVRGEGLVEPEVVPPAHRDQVAEPHVGQLVEDDLAPSQALGVGGRVAEEELVGEGHGAHVLHGPGVELRHEELVVLA